MAGLLALAGCKSEPPTPAQPPPPAKQRAEQAAAPDDPALRCVGDGTFDSLSWIPASARMLIAVDLPSAEVDAAVTLLAAHARSGEHALPLLVDLDVSVLSTELTVLRSLLTRLGLPPRTLVKLHDPQRRPVWLFPASCDLAGLRAAMTGAWGVTMREAVGAWIGSPAPTSSFPFDVVLLPNDRVALVPRGASVPVRAWLDREAPAGDGDGERIQDAAQRLAGAPVVVATAGRALVATGTDDPEDTRERVHTIRADAERLVFDAHVGDTASP
jgi:hypothetical protein